MTETGKGLNLFFSGAVQREVKSFEQQSPREVVRVEEEELYMVPIIRKGVIVGWANAFGKEVW